MHRTVKVVKNRSKSFCRFCKEKKARVGKPMYRVIQKKVLHKSEGKMPQKMKMTLQRAENLVHVKRHYGDSICKEIFFLF